MKKKLHILALLSTVRSGCGAVSPIVSPFELHIKEILLFDIEMLIVKSSSNLFDVSITRAHHKIHYFKVFICFCRFCTISFFEAFQCTNNRPKTNQTAIILQNPKPEAPLGHNF